MLSEKVCGAGLRHGSAPARSTLQLPRRRPISCEYSRVLQIQQKRLKLQGDGSSYTATPSNLCHCLSPFKETGHRRAGRPQQFRTKSSMEKARRNFKQRDPTQPDPSFNSEIG